MAELLNVPRGLKSPQASEEATRWERPHVEVGDLVDYFQDCNWEHPTPALVVAVDVDTVALLGFVKDSMAMDVVPHARHRSDPKLANVDVQMGGGWDHSRQGRRLLRMQADLLNLGIRLQSVEDTLAKALAEIHKLQKQK